MTMRRFRQRERICGVSLAALYDQVGKIADGGAEHQFDAAHGENGDGLLRPRHFREQENEERLVAGRDKHGKERPERDVLPLIQLCRHDGEAAHGDKPRRAADERSDLARECAGGAPDAGVVLHQFDEDI